MLVSLLIAVLVIGLLVWLVQMLPLPEPFKTIAIAIIIVICIIWLLTGFGGYVTPGVHCGRLIC